MSRWLRVSLIVLAVLALAVAAMFLIGGVGGHQPMRHAAAAALPWDGGVQA